MAEAKAKVQEERKNSIHQLFSPDVNRKQKEEENDEMKHHEKSAKEKDDRDMKRNSKGNDKKRRGDEDDKRKPKETDVKQKQGRDLKVKEISDKKTDSKATDRKPKGNDDAKEMYNKPRNTEGDKRECTDGMRVSKEKDGTQELPVVNLQSNTHNFPEDNCDVVLGKRCASTPLKSGNNKVMYAYTVN